MATQIRSSSQLYIDANLDFKDSKGINLIPGTTSGDSVEFDQMNTAIGNAVSGVGNALHVPVADLTASKAVTDYTDKMLMLIETMGLYRFDAQSIVASNNDTVIRPNNIASDATAGRWVKMSSTITDHNLLSSLQGGTTGQYYHLTSAQLGLLSGAALTGTNDTNITLAFNTNAATALLRAAKITVGWTGTLADGRIASAATWNAKQNQLNGTGFIKANGTNISYDNSTYQPLDADLTAIGGLTGTSGYLKKTAANTWALDTMADTMPTFVVSNLAEFTAAYNSIRATYSGGNIYITGDIIMTANMTLDLTGIDIYGMGGVWRFHNGHDMAPTTTLYSITITDGSPTFHNMIFYGSNGSNSYDYTLGTSRNIFTITPSAGNNAVSKVITFEGCSFQDVVCGVSSPVITINAAMNEFAGISLNFDTCKVGTHGVATGLSGFYIAYTHATVSTNINVNVVDQRTASTDESSLYYICKKTSTAAGIWSFNSDETAWINSASDIANINRTNSTLEAKLATTYDLATSYILMSVDTGAGTGDNICRIPASVLTVTPAALTRVNDTNVTLSLSANAGTALLKDVTLTLGWTGTLADARIASAATWNGKVGSVTGAAGITQSGTDNDVILSIASAAGIAGSVGTIVVTNDTVGVALGITSTTAAAGNHTHAGMGTVTSVTAGNGLTQTGTSTINPTINVASAAGTAGSVGTIVITADAVGVALGTTSTTAAAGNHNHDADYQPLDPDLTAIAAITGTSGFLKKTAANTWSLDTNTYLIGTKVDSFNTRTGVVTLTKADVEGVLTGVITSHTHSYQPIDADLTAIAGLTGTSGILTKTAVNTWSLDTNVYLTGITKAMVEAVLTGLITSHTHNYTNNTGTVTSVAAGNGMTFTTITTTGTVALGTPSSITTSSTNSVATGTHTHAITGFEPTIAAGTSTQYYRGDKTWVTLSTSVVAEGTNLYFTDARVAANSAVVLNTAKVTNATHTGDVTGATALTITAHAVTFAKMQTINTKTFLGRTSASTGNVEALTVTQAKALLGLTVSNLSTRYYKVVPTGTVNGTNTVFTIAANILSGTEEVYKNGMLMNLGATNDYTISYGATTTITFVTPPSNSPYADTILVNYSI